MANRCNLSFYAMPRPLAPPARQIQPIWAASPPSRLPSLAAPHAPCRHEVLRRPAPSGCASPHGSFVPTGCAAPHVSASLWIRVSPPRARIPYWNRITRRRPIHLIPLHTSYSSKTRTAPQPATPHLFLVSSSMCCFSGDGLHLLLTTEQAREDNLDRHSTPTRLLLHDPSCSPPSRLWKMNCITVNIKEAMKTTQDDKYWAASTPMINN